MRRKRTLILWQPIAGKKRKLRKRLQSANELLCTGEIPLDVKHGQPMDGNKAVLMPADRSEETTSNLSVEVTSSQEVSCVDAYPIPYDEYLLERARTQWQFGDWESLAKLDRETLQHHPDRAKLALLAAAGNLQTSNTAAAKQLIQLAKEWGCSKKLITQLLVAGVHNSLGKASAITGQEQKALGHFEAAIRIGSPGSDARLLAPARINLQLSQLGIPSQEAKLLSTFKPS